MLCLYYYVYTRHTHVSFQGAVLRNLGEDMLPNVRDFGNSVMVFFRYQPFSQKGTLLILGFYWFLMFILCEPKEFQTSTNLIYIWPFPCYRNPTLQFGYDQKSNCRALKHCCGIWLKNRAQIAWSDIVINADLLVYLEKGLLLNQRVTIFINVFTKHMSVSLFVNTWIEKISHKPVK